MTITVELNIDLRNQGFPQRIRATQADANTRVVEVSLYDGGAVWPIPDGVAAAVGYRKPDGTAGLYDKLPDGSEALTISKNTVTAILAPQVLTAPGIVSAVIILTDDSMRQLSTFPFQIYVEKNPAAGLVVSDNYINVVDAIGDLNTLVTDDKSSLVAAINEIARNNGGTISDEQIAQAVADYLEEHPIEGGYPTTTEITDESTDDEVPTAAAVREYVEQHSGGNAEDGFSPIATVTQTASGAFITITDKDGTTTATITNGKDGKDGADGQDGYTPQKGIDYFDGQPGKDGVDGKDGSDGYTPVKGKDYFDGKDGQDGSPGKDGSDGVSATHSWNGTVLTITSASGTSSADLKGAQGIQGETGAQGPAGADGAKGDKGDPGETGPQGETGKRGTGILKVTTAPASYTTAIGSYTPKYRIALSTVKSQSGVDDVLIGDTIQYSYYHYYVNYLDSSYVYISETRVSIRGATGATGTTGPTGPQGPAGNSGVYLGSEEPTDESVMVWIDPQGDLLTADDVADRVITALGTPVFGTVDENKNIILTGELADGTYTIKYEDADGNVTEVGNIVVAPEPTYTNLFDPSAATLNTRMSGSSGEPKSADGYVMTAIITIPESVDVVGGSYDENTPYIVVPADMWSGSANMFGKKDDGSNAFYVSAEVTAGTTVGAWTKVPIYNQWESSPSAINLIVVSLYVSASAISESDIQNIEIYFNEIPE